MPLLPFDEVLSPDKLVEGKVKLNTTLELIRLFVNALESYVNGLTPEQIDGLIVGGKINSIYLDAFLTSVDATDVTFSSLEAGFTSEDVAAALDYLYTELSNITIPSGFPATSISIVDTDGYYTGTEVETALKEVYEAVASAGGGSPYIADDGRTTGFTLPGVDALSTASIAIGSNAQINESNNSIVLGTNNYVYQGEDTYLMGRSIAVGANTYGNTIFGMFSTIEDTDTSFFWGHSSYLGASLAQTSYSSILMGDGADGNNVYNSIILGSGATVSSNVGIEGAVAIGSGAWVTVAFGGLAGESDGSISIGENAYLESSSYAVLIGGGGTTDGLSDDSVGIGNGTQISSSADSVSVGTLSSVFNSEGAISMGWGATVNTGSTSAIAITPGYGLMQASPDGIGIGHTIDMRDSSGAIAVGAYASVRETGQGSIAIGEFAQVRNTSAGAVAIGQYASIIQTSPSAIAIGNSADVRYSTQGINISNNASTVTYSNYSIIVSTDGFSNVRGTTGFPNSSILNSIFGGESSEVITSDYSTIIGSATATITNAYLGLIIGAESGVVNGANGYAGIIGGVGNEITGVANNNYIFGGSSNEILTDSFQAVILGGSYNTISGDAWFRAILGGEGNVIDGGVFEYNGISPSNQRSYSRRNHEFVIAGDQSASADFNRSGTPNSIYGGGKASTMHMYVKTADATPTYLRADAMNHIPLLNRTATGFKVYLMASNFNAASNESAYWEITFATDVRNGVARLLGTPVINELHKDVPAWDVVVDVETIAPVPTDPQAPFANARIQVTGEAAKNLVWSARVDLSEIDF